MTTSEFKSIFGQHFIHYDVLDDYSNDKLVSSDKGIPNQFAENWHKIRPSDWVRNVSKGTYMKQWKDNDSRRKDASKKLKETWKKNREIMVEHARKNGKHGLFGKLNPFTNKLEYKGKTYYGWRELRENTGVTKHLYKRYYLMGKDPEPRIGCDGPLTGTKYK